MKEQELLERAKHAGDNAYSPYSKLKVGAAILCSDGKIFTGANVENSSYGLTVCAERIAVFNAVSSGHQDFEKIVIHSNNGGHTYPCGACLQVLSEFSKDVGIIISNNSGDLIETSLSRLLIKPFKL